MSISNSLSPAKIPHQNPPPISISTPFLSNSPISTANFFAHRPKPFSPIHLRRSSKTRRGRCRVASPPPKIEPDDDDEESSIQLTGVVATLSRFQDTVRIFFAVFFWMTLFFWSSTWEGWNNDKPDKGSGFR